MANQYLFTGSVDGGLRIHKMQDLFVSGLCQFPVLRSERQQSGVFVKYDDVVWTEQLPFDSEREFSSWLGCNGGT